MVILESLVDIDGIISGFREDLFEEHFIILCNHTFILVQFNMLKYNPCMYKSDNGISWYGIGWQVKMVS